MLSIASPLEIAAVALGVIAAGGLVWLTARGLAGGLVWLTARGLAGDRRLRLAPAPPPAAEPAPPPPAPEATTAADIHMKYTLLAEQNPTLAGQMKLAALLQIHGTHG